MQDSTLIHVSRFVDSAMNESKAKSNIFWYTVESVITT